MNNQALHTLAARDFAHEHPVDRAAVDHFPADPSRDQSSDDLGPEWWPPVWALLEDEAPALPRVLVAEPRPDLRLQIGHALREAGMDADFATNCAEACELVKRQRYDVAVVNPDMEEVGGDTLWHSLARGNGGARTPVITLSDRQTTPEASPSTTDSMHTRLQRPLSSDYFVGTVLRMARGG